MHEEHKKDEQSRRMQNYALVVLVDGLTKLDEFDRAITVARNAIPVRGII